MLCANKLFTLIKTYRGTTIYGEGFLQASVWKYHPLTFKTSSNGFQNIIGRLSKHHPLEGETSSVDLRNIIESKKISRLFNEKDNDYVKESRRLPTLHHKYLISWLLPFSVKYFHRETPLLTGRWGVKLLLFKLFAVCPVLNFNPRKPTQMFDVISYHYHSIRNSSRTNQNVKIINSVTIFF